MGKDWGGAGEAVVVGTGNWLFIAQVFCLSDGVSVVLAPAELLLGPRHLWPTGPSERRWHPLSSCSSGAS